MQYRLLDVFRGLAAISIVFFHNDFGTRLVNFCPAMQQAFRYGWLGVPMFFVISGYCIAASATSCISRELPTGDFLYRRMRRIYPPFWCSIAVVMLFSVIQIGLTYLKTNSAEWPGSGSGQILGLSVWEFVETATLLRIFATIPGTGLWLKFSDSNVVYWSLALEVQFYLAIGLCLSFRSRFSQLFMLITIVAFASLTVPSVLQCGVFFPYWPGFAFGAFLFYMKSRGMTADRILGKWTVFSLAAFLLLFLGLAVALEQNSWLASQAHGCFFYSANFAVILWFLQPFDAYLVSDQRNRFVRQFVKAFLFFGLFSYSIYLVHVPLLVFYRKLFSRICGDSLAQDVFVIGLTIACAYPFFLSCEKPFIAARPSKATAR